MKACFKFHEYPEWFTELKQKKMKGKGVIIASVQENTMDANDKNNGKEKGSQVNWANLIQQEVAKYMQNQNPVMNEASYINFLGFADKNAGGYLTSRHGKNFVWIIDSSASTHLCSNLSLFHTISAIPYKSTITLPDGTFKHVHYFGTIRISPIIILHNVLYVLHFKHNLLSVSSLSKFSKLIARFFSETYFIQDIMAE